MVVNKNLQLIQVLRGIAALLVVFYHTTSNSNEVLQTRFLLNSFKFGGAGVDIFFVLSGFIITYTSIGNKPLNNHLSKFLHRRFVRIYPTYWIIISLFLALQIVLPSFYKTHYSFNPQMLLSTYLLFPAHIMVNGVSWTLSYELFFYFLFSFTFLIRNNTSAFFLAAVYAIVIIILPLAGYNYKNESPWMSLVTNPMNLEFFLGVLTVILVPYLPRRLSLPFIIIGVLIFLLDAFIVNKGLYLFTNGFNRVVLFGIPSFFIVAGVIKYELTNKVSVPAFFLNLGDASYSLYLLHLPVIAACCKIILLLNISSSALLHIILLTLIIIICFSSILFYKLIEKQTISNLNRIKKIKVESEI